MEDVIAVLADGVTAEEVPRSVDVALAPAPARSQGLGGDGILWFGQGEDLCVVR